MSEPGGRENQEGFTREEKLRLSDMKSLIRQAEGDAVLATALGAEPSEAERTPIDPFTGNVIEFFVGVTLHGKPSKWNEEKLRSLYEGFTDTLPADATDEQRDVQERALAWMRDAAVQKDQQAGNADMEILKYVVKGERRSEQPEARVPMTGADPEDFERRERDAEARRQRDRQGFEEAVAAMSAEEARKKAEEEAQRRQRGDHMTDAERKKEAEILSETHRIAQEISQSEYADAFENPQQLMAYARRQASHEGGIGRAITGRTGDENLIASETREQTLLLQDYKEVRTELLKELEEVKRERSGNTEMWDSYGWSVTEGRNDIKLAIIHDFGYAEPEAELIMAAALLHGETPASVKFAMNNAKQQQQGLRGYLESTKMIKDDEDVLSIIEPDAAKREQIYDRLFLIDRPGSFEDTVWQMAHAPGTNEVFKEGRAMALYRNVVVERMEKGKRVLKCEQRVNTDLMAEWLVDRMMEAHGNNTTKALDFENEVKIQKPSMGLPIMVYDMMLARTEKMFISEYLTDTNGNALRFGWVADLYEAVTNILAENRSSGIVIPQKMRGDIQELIAERLRTGVVSNMTRDIGGTSLSEQQRKQSEHGNGRHNADGKIGAVIDNSYIAYCSLYDTEKLAHVLGCESVGELGQIFSLEKLKEARKSMVDSLVGDDKQKYREEFGSDPDQWLSLKPGKPAVKNAQGDVIVPAKSGAKLNAVEIEKVFCLDVPEDDPRYGKLIFLDNSVDASGKPKYTSEKRFEAEANFRMMINFLNNMSPDARSERLIKRIITNRTKALHGVSDTYNGAGFSWRNDYIEMNADGMLYRFGMYSHLDNKLKVEKDGHMHTDYSSRSEESKLTSGFREHYSELYASGGNLFNLKYFPNILLPEALSLRTRSGELYQNLIEKSVMERLGISKEAQARARARFDREATAENGDLYKALQTRIKKIKEVGSMRRNPATSEAEHEVKIADVARREILAEEISRVLTTSPARSTAEQQFKSGQLDSAYQQKKRDLADGEMKGRSQREIDMAAKIKVIDEEEQRIGAVAPEAKVALITRYNEVAQGFQFDGEAERTWVTENYKNSFMLGKELATKTLGLSESISMGPDGPTVNLVKFMESFSKLATETHKSFKNLNMGEYIDAWDRFANPPRMRTMTVAEHRLGPAVLESMGLYYDDGKVDKHGGRVDPDKASGKKEISKGSGKFMKQKDFSRAAMAALVAGEMQLFRQWADWNLSPRFSFAVTMNIREALSRIPGGTDPVTGERIPFFNKHHMDFIGKESQTELFRMYRNEFLSNLILGSRGKKDGLLSGIAELFSIMFKASFQGVATA